MKKARLPNQKAKLATYAYLSKIPSFHLFHYLALFEEGWVIFFCPPCLILFPRKEKDKKRGTTGAIRRPSFSSFTSFYQLVAMSNCVGSASAKPPVSQTMQVPRLLSTRLPKGCTP